MRLCFVCVCVCLCMFLSSFWHRCYLHSQWARLSLQHVSWDSLLTFPPSSLPHLKSSSFSTLISRRVQAWLRADCCWVSCAQFFSVTSFCFLERTPLTWFLKEAQPCQWLISGISLVVKLLLVRKHRLLTLPLHHNKTSLDSLQDKLYTWSPADSVV